MSSEIDEALGRRVFLFFLRIKRGEESLQGKRY